MLRVVIDNKKKIEDTSILSLTIGVIEHLRFSFENLIEYYGYREQYDNEEMFTLDWLHLLEDILEDSNLEYVIEYNDNNEWKSIYNLGAEEINNFL